MPRAPDPLAERFFTSIDELTPGLDGPLGVAVSGGGDSLALMHLLARRAAGGGPALHVATVDHRLRAESADEAKLVREAAAALGFSHEVLEWRGWDGRGNLMAKAREARQALLADWAARRGLSAIALGHTQDDQAETLMLRLARGSGVDGLSAMAARSEAAGALWLRPLLGFGREELRSWLRAQNIRWVDDPSNEDERFERVKIRELLAASGLCAAGLSATASRLREAREALDFAAGALAREAGAWGACGELYLETAPLFAAPRELARRLLRAALICVSGAPYGPRAEDEARLLSKLTEGGAGGGASLHGCLIRPAADGRLLIARELAAAPAPQEAAPGRMIWDGRFALAIGAKGRLSPLGEAGATILARLEKAGEFTPDPAWSAAPRAAKLATPSLWSNGALAAAPLAGYGKGLSAAFIAADKNWPM